MKHLNLLILSAAWIAGIVIANGFWSTLTALVFPFWAYYLIIEALLKHFNIIF